MLQAWLACLLGRTSWQDHAGCGSPPLEVSSSHTPCSWALLTTHGADMGSGQPQSGGKGSALPHGDLAVLCTADAVGYTEVMPWERERVLREVGPGEL